MRSLIWPLVWLGLVVVLAGFTWGTEGTVDLTPDLVVSVVAVAISLCLDVIPGLAPRWEALPKEVKRFTWLIGCLVAGVGIWLLGCLGDFQVGVVLLCTRAGLLVAVRVGFQAYFASQSVHGLYVAVGRIVAERSEPPAVKGL